MRRIVGIETEFGITALRHGAKAMSAEEAARALFHPFSERYHATNAFLTNGGRCYLDVGAHPEYATAECDDLVELIAQDRAGEALVVGLAEQANETLRAEGRDAEIVLFKNNTDSHGNSYGTHENYLVRRVEDFERLSASLLPFLVTRQLLCGAGKVRVDEQGARYEVSQRAPHMLEAVSSATTRSRPMINTRDEPHADPRLYRRLHVIVGDANLSDLGTLLKVGSTTLVLRVLEERGDAELLALALADPGAAIRDTSLDARGRATLRLAHGGEITALDVQRRCLELCQGLDGLGATERRVVALWQEALDALAAGDLDRLSGVAEWALKLRWLQRYAAKHGIPNGPRSLADPRIGQLDLAWHEVTGRGIFRLLEARGAVERVATPDAVGRAQAEPPATTRAVLRSRLVAAAEEADRRYLVDWAGFTCSDLDDGTVKLPDPFAVEDPRVDRLIERMRREPTAGLPFHFAGPGPLV